MESYDCTRGHSKPINREGTQRIELGFRGFHFPQEKGNPKPPRSSLFTPNNLWGILKYLSCNRLSAKQAYIYMMVLHLKLVVIKEFDSVSLSPCWWSFWLSGHDIWKYWWVFLSLFLSCSSFLICIFLSFILFWWIKLEFVDVAQNPFHLILDMIIWLYLHCIQVSLCTYLLMDDTQGIIQIKLFLFLSFFFDNHGSSSIYLPLFILFWWIIMEFVDNVTRNPFHVILNSINVYTFRLFLLSFCLLWYIISIMIIWWLLTVHISQAYIDLYFTHRKIKDAFIF